MALPPQTGRPARRIRETPEHSRILFSEATAGVTPPFTASPLRQPVGLAHQPEPIADIESRFGFAVRVIGFRVFRSMHSSCAPSCIASASSGGRDL